ncbi:hypothetical protein E1301_Tti006356 [Triplophysa tibetana]|uniref:Uncharacterized protein n=1 Tax=Triplophysa tibetana TaxID=1572043 RepID=A0A5A9NX24_9TELE|nr:hypothetical protein E1301_Tti006356 [Triplophysa tibetana]
MKDISWLFRVQCILGKRKEHTIPNKTLLFLLSVNTATHHPDVRGESSGFISNSNRPLDRQWDNSLQTPATIIIGKHLTAAPQRELWDRLADEQIGMQKRTPTAEFGEDEVSEPMMGLLRGWPTLML